MSSAALAYTRFELVRILRNRRFFFLSIGFPVVLFFMIAAPNRGTTNFAHSGLPAAVYYMVGLVSFGTMGAMLSSGARIAAERQAGWNRQLRITPLSPRSYLRAKVVTGYLTACVTIAVLYACGAALGARLPAGHWLAMTGLILVGLVPFAAMGILMGHLLNADSIGPAMGGLISVLAVLGGSWFPVRGTLASIGEALPSYWLVRASHVALGGSAWGAKGWAIMAAWTAVLVVLAAGAYRRDTGRRR